MISKRTTLISLIVLILLGAGVFLIYKNAGKLITTAVNGIGPKITHVETRISNVYINPWTGTGTIHGLFLGNPAGYKSNSAVEAASIKVTIDYSSLTKETIVLKNLVIKSPQITWEGSLTDNNLSQIQKNLESSSKEKSKNSNKNSKKIIIRNLLIQNPKLLVQFMEADKPLEISFPDIAMENIGGDQGASSSQVSAEILGQILNKSSGVVKKTPELIGKGLKSITDGVKNIFK
ncbi:MAG: hypothetical protein J0L93_02825 [Deltaproteobacteria bacterium]|nr:hypothetical protein [Deltaproteobacteria bacterium]